MNGRPLVVVQARMRSSRLPGKTLAEIGGRPLLEWLLMRLTLVRFSGKIVVATSDHQSDDPIAALCDRLDIDCFRGSEEDVLGRYADLVDHYMPPYLAFLGADQPFVSPRDVEAVLDALMRSGDYARTYGQPYGCHVWAVSGFSVRMAHRQAVLQEEREHMGAWWDHHPEVVPCTVLTSYPDLSKHRLTVDHPADLALTEKILTALGGRWPFVTTDEIVALLEEHPEWESETRGIVQWRWEGFDATVGQSG